MGKKRMRLIGIEPDNYRLNPLILQGGLRIVLHFVLHLVKVVHNLLILLRRFLIDNITVNGFHDMVGRPSTALHDILVRDTDRM